MNNRIKELAEQAGYSKDYLTIGLPGNTEKLVELIVQECIGIANKNRTALEMDRNTHLAADAIKRHFGVSE